MSDETHEGKQGPNINNGSWRLEFGRRLYLKDWPISGDFESGASVPVLETKKEES